MRTGWYDSQQGIAFVLPNKVIGVDNVRFQSEHAMHDDFTQKGTLGDWKNEVGSLCQSCCFLSRLHLPDPC